jgi:hypothetical protein
MKPGDDAKATLPGGRTAFGTVAAILRDGRVALVIWGCTGATGGRTVVVPGDAVEPAPNMTPARIVQIGERQGKEPGWSWAIRGKGSGPGRTRTNTKDKPAKANAKPKPEEEDT